MFCNVVGRVESRGQKNKTKPGNICIPLKFHFGFGFSLGNQEEPCSFLCAFLEIAQGFGLCIFKSNRCVSLSPGKHKEDSLFPKQNQMQLWRQLMGSAS